MKSLGRGGQDRHVCGRDTRIAPTILDLACNQNTPPVLPLLGEINPLAWFSRRGDKGVRSI